MAQELSLIRASSSPAAEPSYGGYGSPARMSQPPTAPLPVAASASAPSAQTAPVKQQAAPEQADSEQTRENIQRALEEIAQRMESTQTNLQFRLDDDSGRVVVSVVDARDGKVLKQIPSEVVLRIARAIDSYLEEMHLVEEVA